MNKSQFCTVSLQPYPNRTEHLNIGIAVWKHTGEVKLHLINSLNKIKCFAPNANISKLREWEDGLNDFIKPFDANTPEEQHQIITSITGFKLSESFGFVSYSNETQYAEKVSMMLNSLAEPEPKKTSQKESRSRLNMQLKNAFSAYDWISRSQSDIHKKLIIPKFKLIAEEDAVAEFAYRNGKLNIIESFDFRSAYDSSKRSEARGKALIYDIAHSIENRTVGAFAVVSGAINNKEVQPTLNLLGRYADQVLMWEDASDMSYLMQTIAKDLNKPMLDIQIH